MLVFYFFKGKIKKGNIWFPSKEWMSRPHFFVVVFLFMFCVFFLEKEKYSWSGKRNWWKNFMYKPLSFLLEMENFLWLRSRMRIVMKYTSIFFLGWMSFFLKEIDGFWKGVHFIKKLVLLFFYFLGGPAEHAWIRLVS